MICNGYQEESYSMSSEDLEIIPYPLKMPRKLRKRYDELAIKHRRSTNQEILTALEDWAEQQEEPGKWTEFARALVEQMKEKGIINEPPPRTGRSTPPVAKTGNG
jgi:hypothetical protein